MSEQCQRCGEEGEDRRTLWMACLYEMRELPVPFKLSAIKGVYQEQVGTKRLETLDTDVPVFCDFSRAFRHPIFKTIPPGTAL